MKSTYFGVVVPQISTKHMKGNTIITYVIKNGYSVKIEYLLLSLFIGPCGTFGQNNQ